MKLPTLEDLALCLAILADVVLLALLLLYWL